MPSSLVHSTELLLSVLVTLSSTLLSVQEAYSFSEQVTVLAVVSPLLKFVPTTFSSVLVQAGAAAGDASSIAPLSHVAVLPPKLMYFFLHTS